MAKSNPKPIESSAEHRNEQKKKFVPSSPDSEYLRKDRKGSKAPANLDKLPDKINSAYAKGIDLSKKATEAMLECGALLLEARAQFKGDKEFGQWRKKNIRFSASHVTRLMSVAREFSNEPRALLLPVGTLATLVSASDDLKEEVLTEAEKEDVPTPKRADVIKRKKEEKGEKPASAATAKENPSPTQSPAIDKDKQAEAEQKWEEAQRKIREKKEAAEKSLTLAEKAQVYLDMPFEERVAKLDPRGSADKEVISWQMFGIPPYHDGMPSLDIIHALWHHFAPQLTDDDLISRFTEAYDTLRELY